MTPKQQNNQSERPKKQMLTFGEWVYELLQDERGRVSVKPVIALLGALVLCGSLLANALTDGKFNPADSIVDAIMVITSIGMGADSVDKFSRRRPKRESYGPDYESNGDSEDEEDPPRKKRRSEKNVEREDASI